MSWIVLGEENGRVRLVSKRGTSGLLPKGSFLTVESKDAQFVLRVDESVQAEIYRPSILAADMDLTPLQEDRECRNVAHAYRVHDVSKRSDGLIDFIPPQTPARRSTQEEIDAAIGSSKDGPPVFVATIQASRNQLLRDDTGVPVTARLPRDFYFYQSLICGKTGSGKTVASKYLAQHFVESVGGAVLAVNVKDVDLLTMDQVSRTDSDALLEEWKSLNAEAHGVGGFTVYSPPMITIDPAQGVNPDACATITLDVDQIDPEALTGVMPAITDIGAQSLPGVFRYWKEQADRRKKGEHRSFSQFVDYYSRIEADDRLANVMNSKGDVSQITLHKGTFDSVLRALTYATEFFDNPGSKALTWEDILQRGKLSVINVAGPKGITFGSIFLRDILHNIVEAKRLQRTSVPFLVIIDEVHQFYASDSSREALGDLDTICRTGRSSEIGIIFSTQSPSDIPSGLSNVINTRIFFKSDSSAPKQLGLQVTAEELEGLRAGYAIASIHDMSLLKVVKFPMAFAGVNTPRSAQARGS